MVRSPSLASVLLAAGGIALAFFGLSGRSNALSISSLRRTPVVSVVERSAPAVVNITTNNGGGGRGGGAGSGVIVHPDGFVVTNSHVVRGATRVLVELSRAVKEGRPTFEARVLEDDPAHDLALLQIAKARTFPYVSICASGSVLVGETAVAIGNPYGLGDSVTVGIVSALGRTASLPTGYTLRGLIQTDASINLGNSGGALIDATGKLVGLNSAIAGRQAGIEGIGFAIPVDLVRGVVNAILRDGKVVRGWIGIVPRDLNAAEIEGLGLPGGSVLVRNVYARSPANAQGVTPGDVITQVNGSPLRGAQDLLSRIAMLKPGQGVRLRLWRRGPAESDGLEHNVRIEVVERPQEAGATRSS